MGLLPNTISVAIVAFRPESLQNFSAYIPYKPQNLFSDSVTKFYDFTGESAFGDRPIIEIDRLLLKFSTCVRIFRYNFHFARPLFF
ncbi:MAG: hypothetical protein A3I91_02970 [Candidatus Kerfeldbacteria bacterium RIFCSPLOWO2_02_FULL_42_19]|nr:MAG: hypothetical protein A3I91_02970 [Candidatus Kerfeldbacteria bacterium RIFCSPLOWO2_02_FULL_42_19]